MPPKGRVKRERPKPDLSRDVDFGPSLSDATKPIVRPKAAPQPPRPSPDAVDRNRVAREQNIRRGAAPTGGPGVRSRTEAVKLARSVNAGKASTRDVQKELRRAGFDVQEDGVWGPETDKAWLDYRTALIKSQIANDEARRAIMRRGILEPQGDRSAYRPMERRALGPGAAFAYDVQRNPAVDDMRDLARLQQYGRELAISEAEDEARKDYERSWKGRLTGARGRREISEMASAAGEALTPPSIDPSGYFEALPAIIGSGGDPRNLRRESLELQQQQQAGFLPAEVAKGAAGIADQLVQDIYQSTIGAPAGIAMGVAHPIEAAKAIWNDYRYRYGPIFSGNFAEAGRRQAEHPLFFALDLAFLADWSLRAGQTAGLVRDVNMIRKLKAGDANVQLYNPNYGKGLGGWLGRRLDQFSEAHPDLAIVGAHPRAGVAMRHHRDRATDALRSETIPFQKAAKKLNSTERMAYDVMARYGDRTLPLLELEMNGRRNRLTNPDVTRAEQVAQKAQLRALGAVVDTVSNPKPRLQKALVLGRELTEGDGVSIEGMKTALKQLDPEAGGRRKHLSAQLWDELPKIEEEGARIDFYTYMREQLPDMPAPLASNLLERVYDAAALNHSRMTGQSPMDWYAKFRANRDEGLPFDPADPGEIPANVLAAQSPSYYREFLPGQTQARINFERSLAQNGPRNIDSALRAAFDGAISDRNAELAGKIMDELEFEAARREASGELYQTEAPSVNHDSIIESLKAAGHKLPGGEKKFRDALERTLDLTLRGARYRDWYQRAGTMARNVSEWEGYSVDKTAQIMALYSQSATPTANMAFAIRALREFRDQGEVKTLGAGGTSQLQKANAILSNEHWRWDRSVDPKLSSFYNNILEEADPALWAEKGRKAVTVDRWVVRMLAPHLGDTPGKHYAVMEDALTEMARQLGWHPKEVQAASWVTIKAESLLKRYRSWATERAFTEAGDAYEAGVSKHAARMDLFGSQVVPRYSKGTATKPPDREVIKRDPDAPTGGRSIEGQESLFQKERRAAEIEGKAHLVRYVAPPDRDAIRALAAEYPRVMADRIGDSLRVRAYDGDTLYSDETYSLNLRAMEQEAGGVRQQSAPTKRDIKKLERFNRQALYQIDDSLVAQGAAPDGGFTIDAQGKPHEGGGFGVSIAGAEETFPAAELTAARIEDYMGRHADALEADTGLRVGGWHDPEDGTFYLDLSKVVPDREQAMALAREGEQKAIFNFQTFESEATDGGALMQRGRKMDVTEEPGVVKGAVIGTGDDDLRVYFNPEKADVSTPIHEAGHLIRRFLPEEQMVTLERALNVVDGAWTRNHEEAFAKAVERYFWKGEAPSPQLRESFIMIRDAMRALRKQPARVAEGDVTPNQWELLRVNGVLDEVFNPALALKAGDGAFYMPDIASWRARGIGGGRRKSMRFAPEGMKRNRGILQQQGRLIRGPKVTLAEFNKTAAQYEHSMSLSMLDEIAQPLRLEEFPETGGVPDGYRIFNPKGVEVPRKFRETPTSDDLFGRFPEEMAKEMAVQRDELLLHTFPRQIRDVPEEYRDNVKILPESIVRSFIGDRVTIRMTRSPLVDKITAGLDLTNAVVKAATIYGKLSYIPLNFAGNLIFLTLAAGPFAGPALIRAARGIGGLDPEILARLDVVVGEGAAAALALEDKNPVTRAIGRLAHAQSAVADRLPRRASFVFHAARNGIRSEDDLRRLLMGSADEWRDGITYREALFQIAESAERDMVSFRGMSPFEKEIVSRTLFIYGWLRGATRYGLHSAVNRPFRTDIMLQQGQNAWDEMEGRFGKLVSYIDSVMPIGDITEKLGVPTVKVINTRAINPVSTFGEAVSAIVNTAKGDVKLAGPTISDYLAPGIKTPIEALTGFNTFFMEPYDNRWEAVYGQPSRWPGVRVAKGLISPEITADDISDKPTNRQPNWIVEDGRADALWELFLGSARPRDLNYQAAAARGREETGEKVNPADAAMELARQAGVPAPDAQVLELLKQKAEVDAADSYQDKLERMAEIIGDDRLKTEAKRMPEVEAQAVYESIRDGYFTAANAWEYEMDKIIDAKLEE